MLLWIGLGLLIAAAGLFIALSPPPAGDELGRAERRTTGTLVAGQRARVHGHLTGKPLTGPVSQAPAMVYELRFMKRERGRDNDTHIVEGYRKRDWATGLSLVDAEGAVVLDLTEADLHAPMVSTHGQSQTGQDVALAHAPADVLLNVTKVFERAVKPEQQVAVAGEVTTVAGRLVLGGRRAVIAVEPLPAFTRPAWVNAASGALALAGLVTIALRFIL